MATNTTNYNLEKPEASDPFGDFRQSYNDNLDIIDANLGGGGGGGHTIYDENGSAMTQRAGLEFTGSVSVSDDSVNDKTIVDILGGNVYGAFIDTDRVIKATTTISGVTTVTYTATEDCIVTFTGVSDYEKACEVKIDNIRVWRNYNATNSGGIEANSTNLFLRKGQVFSASNGSSQYNGNYTVYGIKQGSNGIFAPVIYSDTERVVGIWRDNKPLYQRSFDLGSDINISDTAWVSTGITLANVENIINGHGVSNDGSFQGSLMLWDDSSNIKAQTARNNSSALVRYITMWYTKTTDVAGSGNWNTDEMPTVHYSTSEQLIGTYLGKPLYQKTWNNLSVSLTANTWANTGISATDIETIVDGTMQDNNLQKIGGTIGFMSSHTYIGVYPQIGNRDLSTLTVQYTKISD